MLQKDSNKTFTNYHIELLVLFIFYKDPEANLKEVKKLIETTLINPTLINIMINLTLINIKIKLLVVIDMN